MKKLAVLAAVLTALIIGQQRAEAFSLEQIPASTCGILCEGGGGWVYCNATSNGFYAYNPVGGWYRCGYGYAPGQGLYSPVIGFVGSCPGGWPYWGWCWFWRIA